MHGHGTVTFKGVGGWKDGRMHGSAHYTFANGDEYIGEFKDGLKHGKGTYKVKGGTVLRGTFKGGRFTGQSFY